MKILATSEIRVDIICRPTIEWMDSSVALTFSAPTAQFKIQGLCHTLRLNK